MRRTRPAPAAWLFAIALLLVPTAAAAQLPASLVGRPIVRVELAGEVGATRAEDVGLTAGTPVTRRLLRDAILALLDTGRWADVQIDALEVPAGVVLAVQLRPRIVLTRIDVLGNETLTDLDLRRALGLGPGAELEPGSLGELARQVAGLYVERGYVDAQVTMRLRDTDDPSRKVLRVRVVEGAPLRVRALDFDGRAPPSDSLALGALGVSVGAVLDLTAMREGRRRAERRLREEGWLEARLGVARVERLDDGARVTIPLDLGPRYRVRMRGHELFGRDAVEAALELRTERLTRAVLGALEERLVDLQRRHGYLHARAVVDRRRSGSRRANLDITLLPGSLVKVTRVAFPGAEHFTPGYLREQLLSVVEEGLPDDRFFGPVDSDTVDRLGLSGGPTQSRRAVRAPLYVDPSTVFYRPAYEQALEHLREIYQAAGFLSIEVGPVQLDERHPTRAAVTVPVHEGPRTMLFEVTLSGSRVFGDRELLRITQLRRGDPFSRLALEEAIERIETRYRERGYLYARVDPAVRFSGDRERASIALTVVERFEVRVDEIRIEGTVNTQDGLVRDVLRLREGDLIRPSLLEASQDALLALGVFTSVSVSVVDPELPERVKALSIRLRERLPQYVDFSAGISTGQGFRGALEYGYRNLFGYAVSATARAQLGFQFFFQDATLERNITNLALVDRLERRITGSLAIPRISGVDDVRASLDFVHVRDNERSFGLDKNGVILSWLWTPADRLRFVLSGELENNNVDLLGDIQDFDDFREMQTDQRLIRLLRVPEGNSLVVSSRLRAIADQRDNPFAPTTGSYLSASVEWVYTLATQEVDDDGQPFFSNFLKLGGTANGYLSLGNVVVAGQVRAGYIQHLDSGSSTYPNRQYFLGGVDSLRGFNQDQVQPEDVFADLDGGLQPSTVTLGSDFFLLARAELRVPVVSNLQLGLFTDFGNHWRDPTRIAETFALRPTAGVGIRIATPVGPLALDYGFNLDRRTQLNEPFGAFHFSIGVF